MGPVIIDANIAVAQIFTLPFTKESFTLMNYFQNARRPLFAPVLWQYEVLSSVRKGISQKIISAELATKRLTTIYELRIEFVHPSIKLDMMALTWAEKIRAFVAYDAQYLALAEDLGAEFWSADRKLVETVRHFGTKWIHWVGEAPAGES